jgi:hypothetical protein
MYQLRVTTDKITPPIWRVIQVPESVKCNAGKRAAPPGDCGGLHGFSELIHHLLHPKIDGYIELLEWLGDNYDPELFDLKAVNK